MITPLTPPDGTSQAAVDPIDTATIQHTIDRALTDHGALLPYQQYVDLEHLLRGHLQLLLTEAQTTVDRLRPGTPARYAAQARLDTMRHQARRGLGDGLVSAQRQVTALARDCRDLLTQHTGGRP